MTHVVVLGSQREQQTVGETIADLGLQGTIATVTAGWQDLEGDDAELSDQLQGRGINLNLYARAEAVWERDPELRAAHAEVQDRLRRLRVIYNRRLAHLATDWMELLADPGPAELLEPERTMALECIRALDTHHLQRVANMRSSFIREQDLMNRPAIVRERQELTHILEDCQGVVVEGGHVALLHNRMQLFGIRELLDGLTVIGCSGGAMVLGERVVLFHDSPPWGPGHAEVGLVGLGLHRGLVPLANARSRLKLGDDARVRRLIARLAPAQCVALGPGSRLDWDGTAWTPVRADRLDPDGAVRPWESAA